MMRPSIVYASLLQLAVARRSSDAKHAVSLGSDATYCCCASGGCNRETESTKFYWPNENLCCKQRAGKCDALLAFTKYTMPRGEEWCREPSQEPRARAAWQSALSPAADDAGEMENGSAAHTLHTHCAPGSEDDAHGSSAGSSAIIGHLTQELSRNNVQSMVHDIFTIYACVRWAPDGSYVRLARDELESGRLLTRASANGSAELSTARAVERGSFIPLRCSQNIGIYDVSKATGPGQEHYPEFERRLRSLADFFAGEGEGAFDARMRKLMKTRVHDPFSSVEDKHARWVSLLRDSELFSLASMERRGSACAGQPPAMAVDAHNAATAELLQDCAFVAWWVPKLREWSRGFPFQAYLAGAESSSLNPGQHALICFGKRVSGELHRHRAGSHILMDMNGVGCHGFWDFGEAAKMLTRMVELWAPPTCQLAVLELKMKSRLLEMFSTMNKNLFEALPSMVAGESFTDDDPSAKESEGIGKVAAGAKYVVNWMTSASGTYKQLGDIMSSSVMKWSVCPIGQEEGLDGKLGSDDLLTQKFAEKAYQQWTGKKAALPGEACVPLDAEGWAAELAGAEKCELGVVRQNYPEPYKGVEFACPGVPLLPAGQQLRVLSEKHADKCLAMATPEQLLAREWPYKGLRPAEVQYQPRGLGPTSQVELVQVLGVRSRLDTFGTSRDYVTLARACTVDVWGKYPRWCDPPLLLNSASLGERLAGGISEGLGNAVGAVTGIAEMRRHNDRYGWMGWFERQAISTGNGLAQFFRSTAGLAAKMGGASVARMERIRAQRIYSSFEAGEALWGASFQEEKPGGGSRRQFARYAVTFPCAGMDVLTQIKSEYAWGQVALQLLHKATGKSPELAQGSRLSLAVRSEVLLVGGTHLSRVQQLAVGVDAEGGGGAAKHRWFATQSVLPFVEDALKVSPGAAVDPAMPETYGLELRLSCGRRDQIYAGEPATAEEPFLSCVKSGVEQANQRAGAEGDKASMIEKLREELEGAAAELDGIREDIDNAKENDRDALQATADEKGSIVREKEDALSKLLRSKPLTLEDYESEIVVRADFAPLSSAGCLFYKGPAMDEVRAHPPEEEAGAEASPDAYRAEKNAQMVAAMMRKAGACKRTPRETKYHGQAPKGREVLGAYKGGGAPPRAQQEVILSPLDVLPWIRDA